MAEMIVSIYIVRKISYMVQAIIYILSLGKLETVLLHIVEGSSNGEPQTPWLSYISNAAVLSLKFLLFAGQNISSKRWLHDFFNEHSNISPIIFHSQLCVEHTLEWCYKAKLTFFSHFLQ